MPPVNWGEVMNVLIHRDRYPGIGALPEAVGHGSDLDKTTRKRRNY